MSSRAAELIQEIRQITSQYKAEVPGHRRAWPEAIKGRVAELFGLGMRPKKISEATGISSHTVSLWKSQFKRKQEFHQVKIIDSRSKSIAIAEPKSLATVTVRKRRGRPPKTRSQPLEASNLVTVTVTTPEGFRIEGLPVSAALDWLKGGVR